tara:strand:+ start:476 stop:697 length:222 start_codon:yes stop_codon:yes gene_type:complete
VNLIIVYCKYKEETSLTFLEKIETQCSKASGNIEEVWLIQGLKQNLRMRFHQKEPAFKKRNTYGVKAERNKQS